MNLEKDKVESHKVPGYSISTNLVDDAELEHLETLVKTTGMARNKLLRMALLAFTPTQARNESQKLAMGKTEVLRGDLELALEVCGGNLSFVARLLGLNRNSVYHWIKKLGIPNLRVKGYPRARQFTLTQRVFRERKQARQQRDLRLLRGEYAAGSGPGAAGGGQSAP